MKKHYRFFIKSVILAAIIASSGQGCKKDKESGGINENNGTVTGPPCYILRLVDDDEEFIELTFTYNGQDQLTRMDSREGDYSDYKTFEYDNEGNITRIEYYDEDGDLDGHQTFEYSDGKVISGHEYGYQEAIYTYNYDADGILESIDIMGMLSSENVNPGIQRYSRGLLSLQIARLMKESRSSGNTSGFFMAKIAFQWNNNGSVTRESWMSGETVLEQYDYTYDNRRNPFREHKCPVPIIAIAYSRTISANNYTREIWYSVVNGDSETTNVSYQYNGNGYPTSMVFDGSDKYRIEYKCE